jgi:hypothetical protein
MLKIHKEEDSGISEAGPRKREEHEEFLPAPKE